ncbi:hypothetical protein JW823_05840 [bacterium]|nr:hypothetical protein [candidate division CSSED10-310 bacterium]
MPNSQLQQLEQGTAPLGMRMAIAEGLMPLSGDELVQALGYLTRDPNQNVRNALRESLSEMPKGFLVSTAATNNASPDLLYLIAQVMISDEQVIQPLILNRIVDDRTLLFVAENGPPPALEILAQNRNRMLENPIILKKLLENEQLSRVTRFALEEFRGRFNVSFDGIDEEEMDGMMDGAAIESDSREGGTGIAVLPDEEAVSLEDLSTRPLDAGDVEAITDELLPDIDDELRTALIEDALGDDEIAVEELPEIGEEFETEVEAEPGMIPEDGIEEMKGLDDGWNIDALVKEVGGVASEKDVADSFGFDDVMEFSLEDENESERASKEWMGEDVAEFARQHGLKLEDEHEEEDKEEKITDTRIRMMKMSAADKLLLAKLGTKQERAILVTDPNKKVAVAVVEGPKMSEFEIQLIASNRQVYEEVLRAIAQHRKWGRSPSVRRELVLNPKTPLDVTVRMLNSLNDFILKDVVKSKEIPSALALQARRVLDMREQRRSG